MSERRFLVEFPSGSPVSSTCAETLQEGLQELERFRHEGGTLLIIEPVAHMRVGGRLEWLIEPHEPEIAPPTPEPGSMFDHLVRTAQTKATLMGGPALPAHRWRDFIRTLLAVLRDADGQMERAGRVHYGGAIFVWRAMVDAIYPRG